MRNTPFIQMQLPLEQQDGTSDNDFAQFAEAPVQPVQAAFIIIASPNLLCSRAIWSCRTCLRFPRQLTLFDWGCC